VIVTENALETVQDTVLTVSNRSVDDPPAVFVAEKVNIEPPSHQPLHEEYSPLGVEDDPLRVRAVTDTEREDVVPVKVMAGSYCVVQVTASVIAAFIVTEN
jgi:hypothetical protein